MSRIDDTVIKEKLSQSRSFFKQINMYYSKVNLIISLWKRLQIFYIIKLNKLEFDKGGIRMDNNERRKKNHGELLLAL